MDTIIKTRHLTRIFQSGSQQVRAVSDLSLEIGKGTLVLLNGKSGSGKTTLINLLGGLDKPTSGEIWLWEREISRMSDGERDRLHRETVGFVFQSVALMGHMSAYENVEFGLRISGVPAAGRRQKALECLDFVGLSKRIDHIPTQLSGGEQQRVAIARTIARQPEVIFADEPTAQLDSAMGFQVVRLFRRLVEERGITIVMTSHDPEMLQMADQVFYLKDGGLEEEPLCQ